MKGQVFSIDFMMGLVIFGAAILVFFLLSPKPNNFNSLQNQADELSEQLLHSGYPSNWNSSNVIIPGIAVSNRINLSKTASFGALNYEAVKNMLSISSDFFVDFQSIDDLGKKPSNPKELASVRRLVIVNDQLEEMLVQVYDE